MEYFIPGKQIVLSVADQTDRCYQYAIDEAVRLFGKIGCAVTRKTVYGAGQWILGINSEKIAAPEMVVYDGFRLVIDAVSVVIAANQAKGVLNGVYELAERLGFAFLSPGADGEWIPAQAKPVECGEFLMNPCFPYRGIFFTTDDCFTLEEHMTFMAKLKFNVFRNIRDDLQENEAFARLGLRREMGAHLLPKFLDRKLFDEHPEYFRMFQPEDFGGKRMADSNFCITNPDTRRIIAKECQNFLKTLPSDMTAVHAWADDLPSSGWCLCPSCRSYTPVDQNIMSLNLLCRAADAVDSDIRFSICAYHDTLYPSKQIPVDKRLFLVWAPRERCYAHAINDPACERNRIHWEALKQWNDVLDKSGNDGSHTFEYYCDQLLYCGMYPFMPETIAEDAKAYLQGRIEYYMTLQCCAWCILPDYSELFFAKVNWDEDLTREKFLEQLCGKIAGDAADDFRKFLSDKADAFQNGLVMCGHDMGIYLDYRWLPESITPFADQAKNAYRKGGDDLDAAAEFLQSKVAGKGPDMFRKMVEKEYNRTKMEAAQFRSMYYQQAAMNCFGKAMNENDEQAAKTGCEFLKQQIDAVNEASSYSRLTGYPEEWHYTGTRAPWAIQEAEKKMKLYSGFTAI